MIFEVNKNPTSADLRKFGRAMLLGFGVLALVLWAFPWFTGGVAALGWSGSGVQLAAVVLVALGVVLCLISYTSAGLARPIYVVWMTVGIAIGTVVTTVLLTVLFFVLLPLFSLIVRWSDPLRKRLHDGGTYWEDYKAPEATIERMQRPF